jgi:hypothetical protein
MMGRRDGLARDINQFNGSHFTALQATMVARLRVLGFVLRIILCEPRDQKLVGLIEVAFFRIEVETF